MNLIALLTGLVVERLATRFFHLRRMHWLEKMIDTGFRQAERIPHWPALIPITAIVVALVIPVAIAVFAFGDSLFGLPYFVLSVAVLFFSFGPQDIGEDVDMYCDAIEEGDEQRIQYTAKAIIEGDVPADDYARIQKVEESIFVQANNRLFAIIFWFIVFGPLGAWAYRSADQVRRRAVFCVNRKEEPDSTTESIRDAAVELHGWLAWVPARLTAIGYAAAGHFDAAVGAWRAPSEQASDSIPDSNDHLLARVGISALVFEGGDTDPSQRAIDGAAAANRLVFRLLLIWAVVIAAMTLYGWTR